MAGVLTISLDFELYWGVRDKRRLEDYRDNLLGARRAIPLMLDAFRRYGAAATWATVGMLCFDTRSELLDHLPSRRPAYRRGELSPYPDLDGLGPDEQEDPFHYGRSLVRRILDTPRMELGTHTFSHYYCLEEGGQDVAAFEADLVAALGAAATVGARPQSIVFPRNQYDAAALEVCERLGMRAYRGNEPSWLYRARRGEDESLVRRAARLLDAHLPVTAPSTFAVDGLTPPPVDVRSSRLLRPVGGSPAWSDRVRRERIRRGMTGAARRGRGFHLWWHPHNFGADVEANMVELEGHLAHFRALQERYGMRSLTMAEVADERTAAT